MTHPAELINKSWPDMDHAERRLAVDLFLTSLAEMNELNKKDLNEILEKGGCPFKVVGGLYLQMEGTEV